MTPNGMGRAPPSPKRSQGGAPETGSRVIGGRDPNKGVKKKGMVFEATEGTIRPAASHSLNRRPGNQDQDRYRHRLRRRLGRRLYSAGKRRPATTCRYNPKDWRLSRCAMGSRCAGAGRNASVGRVKGRGRRATTRPVDHRDMRAQEFAMEHERQQPAGAWKDEHRGSAS